MLPGIHQQLAHRLKQQQRLILRHLEMDLGHRHGDRHVMLVHVRAEPFEPRRQAVIPQHGRAEFRDQGAGVGQGLGQNAIGFADQLCTLREGLDERFPLPEFEAAQHQQLRRVPSGWTIRNS